MRRELFLDEWLPKYELLSVRFEVAQNPIKPRTVSRTQNEVPDVMIKDNDC